MAGNWFPALQKIALQQHWKLVTEMHATCIWTATLTGDTQIWYTWVPARKPPAAG